MISSEEIFSRVQKVLMDSFELDEEQIRLEAHLYRDLDLDSFDAIDLAVKLDSETGIKLKEDEMSALKTVRDIVVVVEKYLNSPSSVEGSL